VQNPVTAPALAVIIQRRAATARVGPEHSLADVAVTATIQRLVVDLLVVAAGVVLAVDDRVTAAVRVRPVDLFDDRQRTATVSAVVEGLRTAARSVPAMLAHLHQTPGNCRCTVIRL